MERKEETLTIESVERAKNQMRNEFDGAAAKTIDRIYEHSCENNPDGSTETKRTMPLYRFENPPTHRAQLAEKILLTLISNFNDPLRDCTREERAEYAVREADALIAALERR